MFDNVNVVEGPLVLSPPAEVDTAETQLGIRFPTGYREYVTRFGEGVLGGTYVRIYPPRRILSGSNNLAEWRQRIDEYWFWDDGRDVLTKEQALESIIIGDTLDGDELIIHSSNPDRVYVLPRHSEDIHVAGDGLPPPSNGYAAPERSPNRLMRGTSSRSTAVRNKHKGRRLGRDPATYRNTMKQSEPYDLVQRLGEAMSDISEDCYYAGWLIGTESIVPELCRRAAISGHPQNWGHGVVTPELALKLNELAERAGSWANLDESGIGYESFQPFPIPTEYMESIERENPVASSDDKGEEA